MKKSLLAVVVALQAAIPTFASAVSPISEIFIRDPKPEWSEAHETMRGFWDSHESYHKLMHSRVEAFEAAWTMKPKDAKYLTAKRELMRSLQLAHRQLHANLGEDVTTISLPKQESSGAVKTVTKSGRAAIITPLPKRSRRLIELEVKYQLDNRK